MNCISCDNLTHEKCAAKRTPFRCIKCDEVSDEQENGQELNTSDANENNADIDEAFENNVELSEQLLDNMLYVIDQNIHHSSALTTFKCGKCDEVFITVEDLKTHQIQHSSQLLQKSYSFLTRHMHDGNPEIEATLGVHENPIHESTINEHHKPCNTFCDGVVIESSPPPVVRRERKRKKDKNKLLFPFLGKCQKVQKCII